MCCCGAGQVVDIFNAKAFRVLFDSAANEQLKKCLGYVVAWTDGFCFACSRA